MNLTPIEARLKQLLVSEHFASFEQIEEIDDAITSLKSTRPCGFLMFTAEGGGEAHGGTGAVVQKITYRFMAIIGVQGAGVKALSKTGGMEALRDRVKDALFGWKPEGAETSIVLVSARTLMKDLENAMHFIGMEFQTTYHKRAMET